MIDHGELGEGQAWANIVVEVLRRAERLSKSRTLPAECGMEPSANDFLVNGGAFTALYVTVLRASNWRLKTLCQREVMLIGSYGSWLACTHRGVQL